MQALTFFYVWLLISTLFVAKTGWDSPTFVQYLALGLVFVAVKLFPNRRMIAYTLVGVGVAQAVVTVGQQLSLIESNHPYFSVTGFFGNPGPMGGFQAVTLVLAVTLMEDNPLCKWLQKGLWFAVLLIGYSVWCSNSRASWIAVIIGVSVLFYPPLFQWFKNRKWWSLPVGVSGCLLVFTALYLYRPSSVDARVLIARVSADIIIDAPFAGHGAGVFNKKYMLYQADYFERNPQSKYISVADNAAYPYNEFLRIWIELGMIGLLCFVFALWQMIVKGSHATRAPITALIVFSIFSYPFSVDGLLLLFPVLAAMTLPASSDRRIGFPLAISIGGLILAGWIWEYKQVKDLRMNLYQWTYHFDKDAEVYINRHTEWIKATPQLNTMYSLALSQNKDTMDRKKLSIIMPTCENWCDIASIYEKNGLYAEAENYYRQASWMIPTRIRPRYLLFKMYQSIGRNEEAIKLGEEILMMPLKVENTYTLRCKTEIKLFLKNIR